MDFTLEFGVSREELRSPEPEPERTIKWHFSLDRDGHRIAQISAEARVLYQAGTSASVLEVAADSWPMMAEQLLVTMRHAGIGLDLPDFSAIRTGLENRSQDLTELDSWKQFTARDTDLATFSGLNVLAPHPSDDERFRSFVDDLRVRRLGEPDLLTMFAHTYPELESSDLRSLANHYELLYATLQD